MSKVFVTQYSQHLRYADAAEFGEVVFLTQKEFRPQPAPPGINNVIIDEIFDEMESYVPGIDFILLTGSAIPNLIVGGVVGVHEGPHNLLKWSNQLKKYELFILD